MKYWVSVGLFFYYHRIKIFGIEDIPKDKPILFLSNHQNALLDILLIATHCSRKLHFLARADIFKNHFLKSFFSFLQMLPVYRLRDGKSSLAKNQAIFSRCGALLNQGEAILLFPEANHSLKRRVRPLSKGFTRLLFNAWNVDFDLDIYIVPIGQNYQTPTKIADSAALYFGKPIRVNDLRSGSEKKTIENIKVEVTKKMKELTTHIADELSYESRANALASRHVDYLYPKKINLFLNGDTGMNNLPQRKTHLWSDFIKVLIYLMNLPLVLVWRFLLKPKVPEPEFMATFRFGFCLVAFPIFYSIVLVALTYVYDIKTACLFVFGHAVFNLFLIKLPQVITSGNDE